MRQKFRSAPVLVALLCVSVAAGAVWLVMGRSKATVVEGAPGDFTASISDAGQQLGKSTKLPLPRFVSIKADKVNVRRGPSSDHPVAFVFQRKGMPVEITAEFENWRKIRDSDGAEGWILQSMLSGRRNAYVARWDDSKTLNLFYSPTAQGGVVARLSPGVLANIDHCDGTWCEISTGSYDGYAAQAQLWGVYPGEVVD